MWRRKDETRLLSALESELATAQGFRRLRVLDEMAEVHLKLGSTSLAEEAWREALEDEPSWYPATMGLGQLLDRQGRWREFAEHIEDELAAIPPGSTSRIGLLGRLAEIYEVMLDMPERAELVFQELVREKPGAPDAIAGLERIYDRLGQWEALAGLLRRHLDHLKEPPARAQCLIKLGDVFHNRLGDIEEAIRCYEAAQLDRPGDREVEWGLEQLLIAKPSSV